MKIFILILFFIIILTQSLNLITMDLELNSKAFYRIKNIESNLNFSFNSKTSVSFLPEKYTSLIKLILKNKKYLYNCQKNSIFLDNNSYYTFFCEKINDNKNINNIKLKFNFDIYNISINESELFTKKGKYFYFNFLTNNNVSEIVLSTILLDKNIFIRKLEEQQNEEEVEEEEEEEIFNKNENDTFKNDSNRNYKKEKNKKSGIGWIGICLIIILSIIVIYVLYVGFRYYRRKKYQNPSFYYKITEEMFDDITPIE